MTGKKELRAIILTIPGCLPKGTDNDFMIWRIADFGSIFDDIL